MCKGPEVDVSGVSSRNQEKARVAGAVREERALVDESERWNYED